jgi:hypothetical protein
MEIESSRYFRSPASTQDSKMLSQLQSPLFWLPRELRDEISTSLASYRSRRNTLTYFEWKCWMKHHAYVFKQFIKVLINTSCDRLNLINPMCHMYQFSSIPLLSTCGLFAVSLITGKVLLHANVEDWTLILITTIASPTQEICSSFRQASHKRHALKFQNSIKRQDISESFQQRSSSSIALKGFLPRTSVRTPEFWIWWHASKKKLDSSVQENSDICTEECVFQMQQRSSRNAKYE